MAVISAGSADNWQELNVVPKQILRSTDLQSDNIKHSSGIGVGGFFQRSSNDYWQTTIGKFCVLIILSRLYCASSLNNKQSDDEQESTGETEHQVPSLHTF
jgi:hypothetical protein